ncbi:MAG: peptidoglycan-binding protein [Schwartzia sp.]|nr:peptidoglycan-binding protein [Schwartzia sp. (in: firmicutes)]
MKRSVSLLTAAFLIVFFVGQTAFAAAALLREGSRGEAVRAMQQTLIDLEYLKGKPTGVFDKETAAAVRRFQRDRNLEVDGICGPITQKELKRKDLKKAPEAAKETEAREKAEREAAKKKAAHDKEVLEKAMKEGKAVYVSATAYSAYDPGNGPYTASGTPVRHGVIAVDPSFIPIGTRVYIPGYGEAVAEDTGGAIVGNIIDVAFDTHEEAIEFGCQDLEIYIIEFP